MTLENIAISATLIAFELMTSRLEEFFGVAKLLTREESSPCD